LAGVEDANPDIRARLGEAAFERIEGNLGAAESQGPIFRMAGVVEEQHRPLVVLGGLANSLLDPTERGEEIGGLAVEQELGIPRPDSAESGEDVVDLSSVISRVEQGAGVVAPLVVSRHHRETAHSFRPGRQGEEEGEREGNSLQGRSITA